MRRQNTYARPTQPTPGLRAMNDGGPDSRASRLIAEQLRGLPPNHPDREAKLNELRELLKTEFESHQAARDRELAAIENQRPSRQDNR